MNKRKHRRLINQTATLHDKEFVDYDDVEQLLTDILSAAEKAGADMDKLKELVND